MKQTRCSLSQPRQRTRRSPCHYSRNLQHALYSTMSQTLFSFKPSMYHDYDHEFVSSYQSACPVARHTDAGGYLLPVACCLSCVVCVVRMLCVAYAACSCCIALSMLGCIGSFVRCRLQAASTSPPALTCTVRNPRIIQFANHLGQEAWSHNPYSNKIY